MRRLRYILTIIVGLGLVFLCAICALYFLVTPEKVKSRLTEIMYNDFGLTLVFEEDFQLKRLPSLEVVFPSTAIYLDKNAEAIGTVQSITFELNPFAIFAQSPRIQSISFKGLSLSLTKETLQQTLDALHTQQSNGFDVGALLVEDATFHVIPASGTDYFIKSVSFEFNDINEKNAHLKNFYGLLSSQHITGTLRAKAQFDWSDSNTLLEGQNISLLFKGLIDNHDVDTSLHTSTLFVTKNSLATHNIALSVMPDSNQIFNFSASTLRCENGTLSIPALFTTLEKQLPDATVLGKAKSALNYVIAEGDFQLSNISAQLSLALKSTPNNTVYHSDLSGSMAFSSQMKTGKLNVLGTLFETPVSIEGDIILATQEHQPSAINLNTQATGDEHSNVPQESLFQPANEQSSSNNERLFSWPTPLFTGQISLGKIHPQAFKRLLGSAGWIEDLNLDASLKIAEISLLRIPATDIKGKINTTDNTLQLRNLTGHWANGTFSLNAELKPDGSWQTTADIRSLQADAFYTASNLPIGLGGQTNAVLTAKGASLERIPNTLTVSASIKNGFFCGLDLKHIYAVAIDERPDTQPTEALTQESRTYFDQLNFNIALDSDQSFKVNDADIAGNGYNATLSARIDTNDRLSGNACFNYLATTDFPAFNLCSKFKGSVLGIPTWTLDWQSTLHDLRSLRADPPFSVEQLSKKAKRALRNFWDDLDLPRIHLPDIPKFEEFFKKEKTSPTQPEISTI